MAERPVCKSCPMWDGLQVEEFDRFPIGICKLTPPVPVVIDGEIHSARPQTKGGDVCSHHPRWQDYLHGQAQESIERHRAEIARRLFPSDQFEADARSGGGSCG